MTSASVKVGAAVSAVFAGISCGLALAEDPAMAPALAGPNVILLPQIEVPFISSTIQRRAGSPDPSTGGCSFDVDLSAGPGEIAPGQAKARIQRAFDPSTCEELVEEGLVNTIGTVVDSVTGAGTVVTQLLRHAGPTLLTDDGSVGVSAVRQYSARGRVQFTDGNAPLIKPLRQLTNGIVVSSGELSIDLTTGNCSPDELPYAEYNAREVWQPITGWSRQFVSQAEYLLDCSHARSELTGTHQNSSWYWFLFDCRDGVYIRYNPMRLTLNFSGAKNLGGSVTVSGDFTKCGEYIARFETLE